MRGKRLIRSLLLDIITYVALAFLLIWIVMKFLEIFKTPTWVDIAPHAFILIALGAGIERIRQLGKRVEKIEQFSEKLTRLETQMKPLLNFWRDFQQGIATRLINTLFSASNPTPKMEGSELLEKWSKNTLNLNEAKKLKVILEAELEKSKKEKKPFEIISDLTILLAILSGQIERLEEQKS